MSDEHKDNRPHELEHGRQHRHADGRRCCGRPLSEKCNPEEEAANRDPVTGKKSCCRGKH